MERSSMARKITIRLVAAESSIIPTVADITSA